MQMQSKTFQTADNRSLRLELRETCVSRCSKISFLANTLVYLTTIAKAELT